MVGPRLKAALPGILVAGFVLHAEGYFNRNPLDSKRHEMGVWQLPPSLRNAEMPPARPR